MKVPSNVKCDCGHTKKHHYQGGWCHSGDHPKAGQCGCTWFHPNQHYIKRKQNEKRKLKNTNTNRNTSIR